MPTLVVLKHAVSRDTLVPVTLSPLGGTTESVACDKDVVLSALAVWLSMDLTATSTEIRCDVMMSRATQHSTARRQRRENQNRGTVHVIVTSTTHVITSSVCALSERKLLFYANSG